MATKRKANKRQQVRAISRVIKAASKIPPPGLLNFDKVNAYFNDHSTDALGYSIPCFINEGQQAKAREHRMIVQIVHRAGGWHLRLKARNGRILMHSEKYKTRGNAFRAASKIARLIADSNHVRTHEVNR